MAKRYDVLIESDDDPQVIQESVESFYAAQGGSGSKVVSVSEHKSDSKGSK